MSRKRKQDILVCAADHAKGDNLTLIIDHDGKYIHVQEEWLGPLAHRLAALARGQQSGESFIIEAERITTS